MIDLNSIIENDLWYVIGLIATDGYLSLDGRHINITSKDRGYLFSVRKAMGLKNKIGKKYRKINEVKKYSQLQFGDVKFYKYLLRIGLVQKNQPTWLISTFL